MKNTIVVLILLLLSMPSLAQDDAVKQTSLNDNNVVYPQLISFLRSEKNRYRLLFSNNNQSDSKCFIELYNKLNLIHKGGTTKRITFMDGPVIFPLASTVEINKNSIPLYQKYSSINTEPSGALQVLGIVSGIAAGVFFPSYTRTGRNILTAVKPLKMLIWNQFIIIITDKNPERQPKSKKLQ